MGAEIKDKFRDAQALRNRGVDVGVTGGLADLLRRLTRSKN